MATSSKKPLSSSKPVGKPKNNGKRRAAVTSTHEPCECLPCDGKPAGTIFCCEDGVLVDIVPPNYFAVLVFDPSRPGGLPYFEKPENFPPAVIQAMIDATGPPLGARTSGKNPRKR